ncbi:hypothetical protein Pcinc_042894 [Petrolisthes cinctipes]|uniref:Uncharacterized protein n=1 Tax=Petrolisthes cinctipes TaxID=88211 RepID=A0AAE1BGL3_PETCI|nr:hypothetical protein Pcinc_042894 [Petrolisthes cinctipes]
MKRMQEERRRDTPVTMREEVFIDGEGDKEEDVEEEKKDVVMVVVEVEMVEEDIRRHCGRGEKGCCFCGVGGKKNRVEDVEEEKKDMVVVVVVVVVEVEMKMVEEDK